MKWWCFVRKLSSRVLVVSKLLFDTRYLINVKQADVSIIATASESHKRQSNGRAMKVRSAKSGIQ